MVSPSHVTLKIFFFFFFLLWTIFKVFIEVVTILLLFLFYFLFWRHLGGMWDLIALARDQTQPSSLNQ